MDETTLQEHRAARLRRTALAYFGSGPRRRTPSRRRRPAYRPAAPAPRAIVETAESARLRERLGPALVGHVESVALVEAVESTATTTAQSAAPSPLRHDPNWTTEDGGSCFSCSKRGRVYVNREDHTWRHHAPGMHLIVASGTGQDSLSAHLRGYDPSAQIAAESAAHAVVSRVLEAAPPVRDLSEAHRTAQFCLGERTLILSQASRARIATIVEAATGATGAEPGADLHARLARALTGYAR